MEIRPRKKFLSVSFPNVPRSRMVQDGPGTLYVLYIYIYMIYIYIYVIYLYIFIYIYNMLIHFITFHITMA